MSALELHDVRKIYRSGDEELVALDRTQLTIGDDEMVALVGPSGSGKTTLISIAGGLLRPTDGVVVVGGEDISDYDAKRLTRFRSERVGFVFQSVNLVPFLTARENLVALTELTGANRARRKRARSPSRQAARRARHREDAAVTSPPSCRAANVNAWRSAGPS